MISSLMKFIVYFNIKFLNYGFSYKVLSIFMNIISKYLLKWNSYLFFNKTPLIIAVERGNIEIVKLLLSCSQIDVNAKLIHWCLFYIIFNFNIWMIFKTH